MKCKAKQVQICREGGKAEHNQHKVFLYLFPSSPHSQTQKCGGVCTQAVRAPGVIYRSQTGPAPVSPEGSYKQIQLQTSFYCYDTTRTPSLPSAKYLSWHLSFAPLYLPPGTGCSLKTSLLKACLTNCTRVFLGILCQVPISAIQTLQHHPSFSPLLSLGIVPLSPRDWVLHCCLPPSLPAPSLVSPAAKGSSGLYWDIWDDFITQQLCFAFS